MIYKEANKRNWGTIWTCDEKEHPKKLHITQISASWLAERRRSSCHFYGRDQQQAVPIEICRILLGVEHITIVHDRVISFYNLPAKDLKLLALLWVPEKIRTESLLFGPFYFFFFFQRKDRLKKTKQVFEIVKFTFFFESSFSFSQAKKKKKNHKDYDEFKWVLF